MAALLSEYQTLSTQLTHAQDENVLNALKTPAALMTMMDGASELVNDHQSFKASVMDFNALSGGVKGVSF